MPTTATERLRDLIGSELETLVAIRHDLHAHPELGYEEHRTSAVVQRELAEDGIQFAPQLAGGTGVVGFLPGRAGKAIGLRADMDALPIQEENDLAYRSTCDGKMHACGHDGHTTMLLGAARILSRIAKQRELPRPVVFVFQPAEEGGGGGRRMVEDGCLTGANIGCAVEEMYGLHGWPDLAVGSVGTRPGPLLAAADRFRISVRGQGAHAAYPHYGNDVIVAGAEIVSALQTIVSRNTDPLDACVVSVTQVHAGTSHNILPGECRIEGTVRTLSEEVQQHAQRRIEEIARHIGAAHGCTAECEYIHGYPVTLNDPHAVETFNRAARAALGEDHVVAVTRPVMGAEDFSYYCDQVPSCFFFLGLKPEGVERMPNLHAPRFDFNDEAIPIGVELFCRLALRE